MVDIMYTKPDGSVVNGSFERHKNKWNQTPKESSVLDKIKETQIKNIRTFFAVST